jgi:hypothetical protein
MPLRNLPMNPDRPNRRASLTTLVLLTLVIAAPRSASAANPTMSECLSANENAIKLRGDHKLRQARDQALVCAASSCPGEVRETCQARVRDLSAAIPTIVFLAKDGAGQDLVDIRVSMDGEAIGDRLDGTGIPVDPGQHKFTFEVAGQRPVERLLVISEGQKDRREAIRLGAPAASTAPSPNAILAPTTPNGTGTSPASSAVAPTEPVAGGSPGGRQRIAGIVVGAAGVVGLGLGAVFGGLAASDWSSAKAACNGKPVSCTTSSSSPGFQDEGSATTKATISTVGFIAGGALVAGGVVVFLTAPKGSSSEAPASARGVDVVPSAGPGGTGMTIRGRF